VEAETAENAADCGKHEIVGWPGQLVVPVAKRREAIGLARAPTHDELMVNFLRGDVAMQQSWRRPLVLGTLALVTIAGLALLLLFPAVRERERLERSRAAMNQIGAALRAYDERARSATPARE